MRRRKQGDMIMGFDAKIEILHDNRGGRSPGSHCHILKLDAHAKGTRRINRSIERPSSIIPSMHSPMYKGLAIGET